MKMKTVVAVASLLICATSLASCGNTIRGMGRDTANAVHATKDATQDVAHSAQ
ncbi:entericidin [Allorhizobium sp. BGMRC 0089]|nr:entericidin [Allorhizobium sonneratiae]MCM2293726.1 entericidin [Allorhizobium sonneratiae]